MRWRFWMGAGLTLALAAAASARAGQAQQTASQQRALVDGYCVACHNATAKTGGLALDARSLDNVAENAELWEKVVRKLRSRMMPPPGRPRPDEGAYESAIASLETALDRAAEAHPNPGRTETFHRLNRTEYQNAIRDLLGLDVDAAALLPKDDANYGFDNVGAGGLSSSLVERYLTAAQKVSRLAIGLPSRAPVSHIVVLPADLTQEGHVDGLPFGTRGGTLVRYDFPADGEYEIQTRLMRNRNENVEGLTEPHQIELTLDGARLELFTVRPQRTASAGGYYYDADVDKHLHIRIPVQAGPHAVGAAFMLKSSALIETERQPYEAHFNMDRHPRTQPAVYSVSITGPFNVAGVGDTPSRERIFTCRPPKAATIAAEENCAQTIIGTLARRAYRRSVSADDLRAPLTFFREARAEGDFETGIDMALRSILSSPEFLIRVESDPENAAPNSVYRISDVELASRLSFFLWSSIPDEELLNLASRGTLHDPATLELQVRRMLADPRSRSLATNFAGQWLYLRNLAAAGPDARLFPDFDDNLRQAMRRETELLFESIVSEDRGIVDLIGANYTFLNERLAKHYGIPNVYGSNFRRVTLPADSLRSGLFGQGSILTVTSYGNRTSPVLRGKWVLENILGAAPPAPPANVPPLPENNPTGKIPTMRERMAEHRANPACAGCHQLMDPIGLAMENFDAIGRWRARGDGGAAIDASGALPSGVTFDGVAGLRSVLIERPETFVTTAVEKLLTYSLGRGLDYGDAPAVRAIVREARGQNYRFSSLILGVVKSIPFQMRRTR